jgi:murein DD-endopeptidase MepM/ murein hydrolase activator NlpD
MKWIYFLLIMAMAGCYTTTNPLRKQIKKLQDGEVKDDSSFVYALPYERGKSFRVIQGYFSQFSHRERAALDFNMKPGTKVFAARGGVVVRVKQDGDRGGWNKKFRPYGNNIVIQHDDGSRSGYWHLQHNGAMVKVGDTVKQGQNIALSGNTGYAAFAHLHFLVWQSNSSGWQQIPTRFKTANGIKYLKFWGKYKNP